MKKSQKTSSRTVNTKPSQISKADRQGRVIAKQLLQRRVARLLIAGLSIRKISVRIGRSPKGVRDLISNKNFPDIAHQVEIEIHGNIDLQFAGLIRKSIRRLSWLLDQKHNPDTVGAAIDRVFRFDKERNVNIPTEDARGLEAQQMLLESNQEESLSQDEVDRGMEIIRAMKTERKAMMTIDATPNRETK